MPLPFSYVIVYDNLPYWRRSAAKKPSDHQPHNAEITRLKFIFVGEMLHNILDAALENVA